MALPLIASGIGLYKFFTGAGLLTALKYVTIYLIAKAIYIFGVGYLVYTGLDVYMATATSKIFDYSQLQNVSGFPEAVQMLHKMRLPDAINLIMSTYTAVISLKLTQGAYRTMTLGLG